MIMNHQHKWSTMASNSHLNTVNVEWVAAVYADLASPASALLNAPETVNEYEKFINQAKREWVKLRCEQRQLFVFVQIIFHSHINTQSQLGTMTRMIMSLCVASRMRIRELLFFMSNHNFYLHYFRWNIYLPQTECLKLRENWNSKRTVTSTNSYYCRFMDVTQNHRVHYSVIHNSQGVKYEI